MSTCCQRCNYAANISVQIVNVVNIQISQNALIKSLSHWDTALPSPFYRSPALLAWRRHCAVAGVQGGCGQSGPGRTPMGRRLWRAAPGDARGYFECGSDIWHTVQPGPLVTANTMIGTQRCNPVELK